jgi:hypothetical protein
MQDAKDARGGGGRAEGEREGRCAGGLQQKANARADVRGSGEKIDKN